jgi:hypothetical protein
MSSVIQVSQVYYPESDGKPMGETDFHREEMVRHIELLKDYYRGQKVYLVCRLPPANGEGKGSDDWREWRTHSHKIIAIAALPVILPGL